MTFSPLRCIIAGALAALAALPAPSSAGAALADSPFAQLAGSWSGSGQVILADGKSERLSCRGYYLLKDDGEGLGLAIRCASPAYKLDLRSALRYEGGRISGSWEERTFNAVGSVSGRAAGGSLNLAITGGGLNGSMSISYGGAQQAVSITAEGVGFKGVSMRLSRS